MTGLVQPFISTVAGSLDSKGRVCIPATHRQLLAAQNTQGIYILPSFIDPAIEAFGQYLLDALSQRLVNLDPFSAAHDDEATGLLGRTTQLPIDENGRIRIPDALIARAGLKDKVIFVGKGQKFQIWDAERYAPVEAEALARMKARMERARDEGKKGGDA